jgi:Holliday junction resolvase RusA-like endonuclease
MVESSAKVAPWRAVVTAAAADAKVARSWDPPRDAALTLYAVFTLSRPNSHYRTGKYAASLRDNAPEHPATRPDVDKLLRSTFDALTDAGAMAEDSRVVYVNAVKAYPGGHVDALDTAGAVLVLSVT